MACSFSGSIALAGLPTNPAMSFTLDGSNICVRVYCVTDANGGSITFDKSYTSITADAVIAADLASEITSRFSSDNSTLYQRGLDITDLVHTALKT